VTERVTKITVRAFRGVPNELTIELPDGRSLVALGDNGTGKSTIADALEFYFTGQIRFLAREGRAIVQHQSADPDDAFVEIETTGALGGHATRSDFVSAARSVGTRESFLLSGRTLAEFVDKTKNEKWRHLFEILGLETVDHLRRDLQQARNSLEGDRARVQGGRESAVLALRGRCSEVTETGLLAAIKVSSRRAGVDPPSSLEAALQQDWAAAMSARSGAVRLATEFQMVVEQIGAPPSLPSVALLRAWNRTVASIQGAAISRVRLLEAAREHLERTQSLETCPVCGQAVEQAILRKRISDALEELRSSSQALESARRTLGKFINGVSSATEHRRAIVARASRLGVQLPAVPGGLASILDLAKERATEVDLDEVETEVRRLTDWDSVAVKLTREGAPTITPQDADVVNLVLLVNQGKDWLQAEAALRQADRALDLASRMYEGYESRMNEFLTAVLSRISWRVASIYARLHPEESVQNISVETWGEKGVELAVEFHGMRQRPPHGVLSESHLNSLGIALFLAMAETFNEHLHFLVLDDVVNSLVFRGYAVGLSAVSSTSGNRSRVCWSG
jgi:AAA domain